MCKQGLDSLLDVSLKAFEEEHRELSETWRHIETKAQGTVAISGIFLAGVFAFIRFRWDDAGSAEALLLVLSMLLIVCSVIGSLMALRVRSVSAAPRGEQLHRLVEDLQDAGEAETPERIRRFLGDQIGSWKSVNEAVQRINSNKAGWLMTAQVFLLAAIVCFGVLTLLAIGGVGGPKQ